MGSYYADLPPGICGGRVTRTLHLCGKVHDPVHTMA